VLLFSEDTMTNKFKLLIIDDSEVIVEMLYQFFKSKNYELVSASNGLDGIKLFNADPDGFDLVITDIVMPNISGVGVISILKNKRPELPIIAITGFGEHPESLAAEAHADVVLEKPIDLNVLDDHISVLISKK
jgi:DNA-binding response OmpR family regulator